MERHRPLRKPHPRREVAWGTRESKRGFTMCQIGPTMTIDPTFAQTDPQLMVTLRNTAIGLLRHLKRPIRRTVKHLDRHPEQIAALALISPRPAPGRRRGFRHVRDRRSPPPKDPFSGTTHDENASRPYRRNILLRPLPLPCLLCKRIRPSAQEGSRATRCSRAKSQYKRPATTKPT